jgi:hypothetical protein
MGNSSSALTQKQEEIKILDMEFGNFIKNYTKKNVNAYIPISVLYATFCHYMKLPNNLVSKVQEYIEHQVIQRHSEWDFRVVGYYKTNSLLSSGGFLFIGRELLIENL